MTSQRARAWWSPGWSWRVWAIMLFFLVPTLGFALWVFSQAGGQTKIDSTLIPVASENADGSDITVITGRGHTVYHANKALPDAKSPRADDQLTLVWFTSQGCTVCEQELFVHRFMENYHGRVVFMEKAVDRETADERLGVKELPTFVWLDAQGNEKGRFGPVKDEAELRAEVEKFAPTN
jgi:hypothetical protein